MTMAIKARSFRDAKAQAKSNPELVWWVFMRLSGSALVLLTLFHLFKNHIAVDEARWDYEAVASSYANWWNKLYLFALLGLGLMHGGNGIRYVIDDATAKNPAARFWIKSIVYSLIGAVLVFGLLALIVEIPVPGVPN
jgi:succinate dehydrogenase / fumarate reductase, membrane anchor subunit